MFNVIFKIYELQDNDLGLLFIADEPSNHLDMDAIEALIEGLE